MNARYILVALPIVAGVLLLVNTGERPLRAIPPLEREAPVPHALDSEWSWTQFAGTPQGERDALIRRHNDTVGALVALRAQAEAGTARARDAERLEFDLLDLRHALGALDRRAWHGAVADLMEREVIRLKALAAMDPPLASQRRVDRARAYLLRERWRAGDDAEDYADVRKRVLHQAELDLRHLEPSRRRMLPGLRDTLAVLKRDLPDPTASAAP